MKKRGMIFIQLVLFVVFMVGFAEAGEWRFPVGLTYISGFGDIVDIIEDNSGATDTGYVPVGISFQPYLQFENGLGVGGGIGPLMIVMGDADFFNVPLNLICRYTFNHQGNVSPYVRAGVSRNFASGDYLEGSKVGFFSGIGVEFLKDKKVNMGIQASYDTSEIEMEKTRGFYESTKEDIKPMGFMFSVYAVF